MKRIYCCGLVVLLGAASAVLAQGLVSLVSFRSFNVNGSIQLPQQSNPTASVDLRAKFTLGDLSNGLMPGSEPLRVVIEPDSVGQYVSPCFIVELAPGSLSRDTIRGGWKLSQRAISGLRVYLQFPDKSTTKDLTGSVTDAEVRLAQSTTDKSWELKLEIDLAGPDLAFFPTNPSLVTTLLGDDAGQTHVAAETDFHSVD